jgi:hypothetical protein
VSSTGYTTAATTEEFLLHRLRSTIATYYLLDFLSVFMKKDPFFVFGPTAIRLPPLLEALPPAVLTLYRNLFVLTAVLSALVFVFSINDLVHYFIVSRVLGLRGELWQYASVFGSFSEVLDHGLAGFWGAWWHQTFRFVFTAPTKWMIRQGYIEAGSRNAKLVGMFVAFVQSGFLHACGSYTSIPTTKWWLPSVFFLLSGVGMVIQQTACEKLEPIISRLPRVMRRAGNFIFVFAWLHYTVWPFSNDLAFTGLWLLEPIPISPLCWLGFGQQNDSWWRWDSAHLPGLIRGSYWWESGIGG